MNDNHPDRIATNVKRALQSTPECLPLDRLGSSLSEVERVHVESCLRCQTEMAVWEALERTDREPSEGAAVQWIAAELKRRRSPQRTDASVPWRVLQSVRGLAALAASAALAITIGYIAWDREPGVGEPRDQAPIYRAGQLQTIAPLGDVSSAPQKLEWSAVAGAARYDVSVLEVDRSVIWRTSVETTKVILPDSVSKLCVPGKTLLWEISARDRSGVVVAESGTQRFRVSLQ